MRILFTPFARKQFLDALEFIKKDRPAAAREFRDKAETVLRRLAEFPESGRHLPEFPELPFREVLVPPYRFFYQVKQDDVWIVAAWQDAQLPAPPAP